MEDYDRNLLEYGLYEVSESMEEQEKIQKKIDAYEQIDSDVVNGIAPF